MHYMLTTAIFQIEGSMYTVYEIIEQGFNRIDILRGNANFQTDIDAVVYSMVYRRKTYSIGDKEIYQKYINLKEDISNKKLKSEMKSSWENGEFVIRRNSHNAAEGIYYNTVHRNGILSEIDLRTPGASIYWIVSDPIYGVKLLPMNFSMYEVSSVSEDTVTESKALYKDITELKRRYDIAHLDSMDFCVATSTVTAMARLEQIKNSKSPLIGVDTETTGLDVTLYGEDRMVGIIVAADKYTSTYFPFRHEQGFNLSLDFLPTLMQLLMEIQYKLVAHNVSFDRKVFLKEGYDLVIAWDTMQMSYIDVPKKEPGLHALKNLMFKLNGKRYLELTDIFINKKDIDFGILDEGVVKYYACPDASSVVELAEYFLEKIPKYQRKLLYLECALANVKADQEYWGIRVDVKKYIKQYRNCNYIIDTLLKCFRLLTKEDGNINSQPVLQSLIYDKMRCKVLNYTPKGLPSTSAPAIKKLGTIKAEKEHNITEDIVDMYGNVIISASDLSKAKYPALLILSKYREYNKLKTAFYARFERTMKTGRVFFWIDQNGAGTGRQSSPMHQLPPALKEVILSDHEESDFWGPDYSQIELRMIAYLSGEPELSEMCKDPENDIHRIIGALISAKEMWEITAKERGEGKRRNFGVVYVISAMGLAAQIFGPGYTEENVEYCQNQIDEFFKRFKYIDRYIKNNAKIVKKRGYMMTAWYNRKRMFDEIFDPNIEPRVKASILRKANNVPVQGTSADYMKLAEVQGDEYIRMKGWNKIVDGFPMVRLMLSIHDELILSAHKSIPTEEIVEMITKCMQTPVDDAPPFFVQPARMTSWADHSDDSLAMPILFRDKIIEDYNKTGKTIFKHSYFKLIMPEDVVKYIKEHEDSNTKKLVNSLYNKCSLEFIKGDYVTEYTDNHVKEALEAYIESDVTVYRIDNYRKLINDYVNDRLSEYMNDLIQKYGTDYKIVGQKVRHPSLTHSLLNVYHKQLKGLSLSHEEQIVEATRLYIEDLQSTEVKQSNEVEVEVNKDTIETESEKEVYKDLIFDQLDSIMRFDNDGNVIYETDENSDDVEDKYTSWEVDDFDSVLQRLEEDPYYAWELGDTIVLDVSQLDEDKVNKVLSYMYNIKKDGGFYRIYINYGGKLIDTKMQLEEFNQKEVNKVILDLMEVN